MSERTHVLGVYKFRRTARRVERRLQEILVSERQNPSPLRQSVRGAGIPTWARGVRVEKAGPFQWAVVATETQGR